MTDKATDGIDTKAVAARAERVLRDPNASDRDGRKALLELIENHETLADVRAAVVGVGCHVFYMCELDRCISNDVTELWPDPTTILGDLAKTLRDLSNEGSQL